jgi:hypothetical protein
VTAEAQTNRHFWFTVSVVCHCKQRGAVPICTSRLLQQEVDGSKVNLTHCIMTGLTALPNIGMINSMRMRWGSHVAGIAEDTYTKLRQKHPKKRDHYNGTGVDLRQYPPPPSYLTTRFNYRDFTASGGSMMKHKGHLRKRSWPNR